MTLNRMGYGAMQLAGPQVWGPPRDVDAAIAVLREAVAAGVNHIDTSDYYGPHVTNQLIKQALHPYPEGLVIVTKLGARRGADKSWLHALSRQELIDGVHDNLRNLGRDTLDVVNLRVGGVMGPSDGSIEEPLTVLAELQRQGLIRHIGLSNVTPKQFAQGRTIAEIVCVQNAYNVAHRNDDGFVDDLAARGVAYVPFFPLGGFTPLQSSILDAAAASLQATPMQLALAWLLQRSPNILLIPGTSSVAHLRENLEASQLEIPREVLGDLDSLGRFKAAPPDEWSRSLPHQPGAHRPRHQIRRVGLNEMARAGNRAIVRSFSTSPTYRPAPARAAPCREPVDHQHRTLDLGHSARCLPRRLAEGSSACSSSASPSKSGASERLDVTLCRIRIGFTHRGQSFRPSRRLLRPPGPLEARA